LPQSSNELESVHERHPEIGDQHVGMRGANLLQRGRAGRRGRDVSAGRFENLLEQPQRIRLIVYREDVRAAEIGELVGEDPDRVLRISAKTGEGVAQVLDAIVERVPPPAGDTEAPARPSASGCRS